MDCEGHIRAGLDGNAPPEFWAVLVVGQGPGPHRGIASAGLGMAPTGHVRLRLVEHRCPTHPVRFADVVNLAVGIACAVSGAQAGVLVACFVRDRTLRRTRFDPGL